MLWDIWDTELSAPDKNPGFIFISWLYAKWILKVDTEGRFPEKVAKPTVSNP